MVSTIFAEDFFKEFLEESGVTLSSTVDLLVVVLVVKFFKLEGLGPAGSCVLPLSLFTSGAFVKVTDILILLELNGEVIPPAAHVYPKFDILVIANFSVRAPGVALFLGPKIVATAMASNDVRIQAVRANGALCPLTWGYLCENTIND